MGKVEIDALLDKLADKVPWALTETLLDTMSDVEVNAVLEADRHASRS